MVGVLCDIGLVTVGRKHEELDELEPRDDAPASVRARPPDGHGPPRSTHKACDCHNHPRTFRDKYVASPAK